MFTAVKWLIILVVLAGLGWFVWYSGWLSSILGPKPAPVTQQVATTTPTTPTPPVNLNGMSPANDASDAGISQDIMAVDTQVQGFATDTASIEQSLSDKPLPQAF